MRCHIQSVASHLGLHCLLMSLVCISLVLIRLTEDIFLHYLNPLQTRNPLTGTLAHSEDFDEMLHHELFATTKSIFRERNTILFGQL